MGCYYYRASGAVVNAPRSVSPRSWVRTRPFPRRILHSYFTLLNEAKVPLWTTYRGSVRTVLRERDEGFTPCSRGRLRCASGRVVRPLRSGRKQQWRRRRRRMGWRVEGGGWSEPYAWRCPYAAQACLLAYLLAPLGARLWFADHPYVKYVYLFYCVPAPLNFVPLPAL